MPNEQNIRESMPVHKDRDVKPAGPFSLRVDGLVDRPLQFTLADLQRLPQQDFTDDFRCLEGWKVPDQHWHGVRLGNLLSLASPRAEARYVQASSGDFSLALTRDEADHALIALRLNGALLPSENGGPARLIVPGGQCFTSIKWLDHLELRSEPGANTAESTARARLPKSSTP